MSFEEGKTGLGVSAQYGERKVGGSNGIVKNFGVFNQEAYANFDNDILQKASDIPSGAIVTAIKEVFSTGAVTAMTIGGVDTALTFPFEVVTGGEVVITGPTAGTVYVIYDYQGDYTF